MADRHLAADECRPRRDFPGRRWLSVVLRGLHLVAVILLGGAMLGAAMTFDERSLGLAVFWTGLLLWGLDIWSKPEHLREWAGVSMILKLALVLGMVLLPGVREMLFWIVVLWSAVFSHAPGSFRNAKVF